MSSQTLTLPCDPDVLAPDGSEVRILLALSGGSMAHFRLPPAQISRAVRHRTVEEVWFVVSGAGQMWRSDVGVVPLAAGVCLSIPVAVSFQFRSTADEALAAVAVTMPPWSGDAEAEVVEGVWRSTFADKDADPATPF